MRSESCVATMCLPSGRPSRAFHWLRPCENVGCSSNDARSSEHSQEWLCHKKPKMAAPRKAKNRPATRNQSWITNLVNHIPLHPPLFLDVWQMQDLESSDFGSVASKGVTGEFLGCVASKRLSGENAELEA